MPAVQEPPQGHHDLLRLIARLQTIEHADPAKGAACQELLAKLQPYADQRDYFPPPGSSAPPGHASGHAGR